jgi:hypothetical protein
MAMEVAMEHPTPLVSKEQWMARLQGWAVERWGEARAQAIREEIAATAEHLVAVSDYALTMEQIPGFFMEA